MQGLCREPQHVSSCEDWRGEDISEVWPDCRDINAQGRVEINTKPGRLTDLTCCRAMHLSSSPRPSTPGPPAWARTGRLCAGRCWTWTWWANPRLTSPRARRSRDRRRRERWMEASRCLEDSPCWQPTTCQAWGQGTPPSPLPREPGWRRETAMRVRSKFFSGKKYFWCKKL